MSASPGQGLSQSAAASARKTVVFVHIPKTAGTAFSHYLKRHCGAPEKVMMTFYGDYSIYDGVRDVPVVLGHTLYREMSAKFPDAAFVTWLRDPLKRVVSQYKSWHNPKKLNQHWKDAADGKNFRHNFEHIYFTQNATFEEFALSDSSAVLNNIQNFQTVVLSSYRPKKVSSGVSGRLLAWEPLRRMKARRDGARMLASAKENLERAFAFCGIVERFDESIRLFQHRLGWQAPFRDYEAAANRSAPVEIDLTDRAVARVMELNDLDMQLYEFGCRLLDERLRRLPTGGSAAAA